MSDNPSEDSAIIARLARTILGVNLGGPPVLVAGRVPDGWPPDLVPPPPATALGGMTVGRSSTAVFVYPSNVAAPLTEYRALLEANGWKPPRGVFAEGFDSARMAMLCRGASRVMVYRASPDLTDNSMVVSLATGDGFGCEEADRRMPDFGTITVPRLTPPAGVRWDSGGGGGGGGDHTHRHIRVTTDLSPDELLSLYAGQLAGAGWQTGAVQSASGTAIQSLEARDARGRVWRGMLTVYVNGAAREVFIYMAMVVT
jgi:hypothetical protein